MHIGIASGTIQSIQFRKSRPRHFRLHLLGVRVGTLLDRDFTLYESNYAITNHSICDTNRQPKIPPSSCLLMFQTATRTVGVYIFDLLLSNFHLVPAVQCGDDWLAWQMLRNTRNQTALPRN